MSKNILTRAAVASLAALVTIPNITIPKKVYASFNVTDEQAGTGCGKILSATNQGQYTQLTDDWGNTHLVNSSQWQEYQLLLQQGSPEVILVLSGWSEQGFYSISSYQLKGQTKVDLPKDKQIKVTDPYNCDQLSILKYLGNQLGSSYLIKRQENKK